jgi:ubiquitin-conjugating enzyme E2 S
MNNHRLTQHQQVLQVIRCLLIVPFPESSLNDEAGKLFMESYDEFARRARIMTEVHAMTPGDEEDAVGEKCSSSSESSSSGTATVPTKQSVKATKEKTKEKEAKKKSLKRL